MAKKAQSGLEFLMTYGWAFLVLILVIVVLYTLGVVDFLNWVPSYCRFDSGNIECSAYVLDADIEKINEEPTDNGYLLLKLTNYFNEPIVVTGCEAIVDDQPFCIDEATEKTSFTTEGRDTFINCSNTIWPEGEDLNLKLTSCEYDKNSLDPGKKRKISVALSYYPRRHGAAFTKTIKGDVFAMIEE
ncbi:MAG: hypothetical protein ACOC32_03245 [Nanoarchaeota archaeon]